MTYEARTWAPRGGFKTYEVNAPPGDTKTAIARARRRRPKACEISVEPKRQEPSS